MIRHLFAASICIAIAPAIVGVTYLALLVQASFFGGGLGGPLALPAGLLLATGLGVAITFGVLMPCVAAAEFTVSRPRLRLRRRARALIELPLALGFALLPCLSVFFLGRTGVESEALPPISGVEALGLWAMLLVPVAIYWLCVRSCAVMIGVPMAVIARLRWRWAIWRSARP